MNDTTIPQPSTETAPDQSGVAPVNAFVAALADQVFQRVTVLLTEKLATLTTEDTMPKAQIKTLVDERISSYIDDLNLPDEQEVESMVENYLDRNLDVTDAVREALDDIDLADKIDTDDITRNVLDDSSFEEKVKEIVQGMTFDVSVS